MGRTCAEDGRLDVEVACERGGNAKEEPFSMLTLNPILDIHV